MITTINEWSLFNKAKKQDNNQQIKDIINKINNVVNSYTDIYGPYSTKQGTSMKVIIDGKTIEVYKEDWRMYPKFEIYINNVLQVVNNELANKLYNLLIYKQTLTQ